MGHLIDENKVTSSDVKVYLQHTEIVGELAAHCTWQSVLLFDEEYQQQQAKQGSPGGPTPYTWAL